MVGGRKPTANDVGWAIGNGEEYPESEWEHQNYVESEALYNLLEQDIIPLYYTRGRDGLPREWIERVKRSMRKLAPYLQHTAHGAGICR